MLSVHHVAIYNIIVCIRVCKWWGMGWGGGRGSRDAQCDDGQLMKCCSAPASSKIYCTTQCSQCFLCQLDEC